MAIVHLVLLRASKYLVVLTLALSLSAHWMLLQSVAWVGMMVSYSRDTSLTVAVSKTFDGQHPCRLCKVVQEGKASEKKQETQKPEIKLDKFLPIGRAFTLYPPEFSSRTFDPLNHLALRPLAPPTPPPRSV